MLTKALAFIVSCFLPFTASALQAADYSNNLLQTGKYIAGNQLPSGAIRYTSTYINPYFGNIAAIGWLKDKSTNRIPAVEAWISWYIKHLNWPDYSKIYGTVYDYTVDANGKETPKIGYYDSADSYAATFLTLVKALWDTGDPSARAYVKSIGWYTLNVVGNVITNLQQPDGLVIAKADYAIKYTMDNAEDYRGLSDLAALALQAFNDDASRQWYTIRAEQIRTGMQTYLKVANSDLYYPWRGAPAPNLKKWYPDATAQLFPILFGVIPPTSSQAKNIYTAFNVAWSGWPQLSFNTAAGGDAFPWCAVGYTAYLMGDRIRADQYVTSMMNKYVNANPRFPWPFYVGEGGWFMLTNAGMTGK